MLVIGSRIVAKIQRIFATIILPITSQNALRTLLTFDLYYREPEDDSKRVETCRPKIIFYVITTVVFD